MREKFLKGLIAEKEFTKEAVTMSVNSLKAQDYYLFIRRLDSGSFGTVFHARNQQSENMAIKIVLKERVNINELNIWPSLKNENVLSLYDVKYIPSAGTYAFFMPLIPTTLDHMLEDSAFAIDKKGIVFAKSFLKDVLRGVQYLHSRKLCHLDIKPSNVLISDAGRAVLCDFSSLSMTEAGTDRYASPFLYRPAEAVKIGGRKTVVNGFSYDIYTMAFLALELFTNQEVLKSCRHSLDKGSTWSLQMYPRIYEILQKKKFEKAVKKAFVSSEVDAKLINILLNFIKSCMRLNPRLRPSLDEMQGHKIFGGTNLFQKRENDVWEKKATSKKLDFLISLFIAQASSLSLPSECDSCDEMKSSQNHEEQKPICDVEYSVQTSRDKVKDVPECDSEVKSSKKGKVKDVPECDSEMKSSKKESFVRWVADKTSSFCDRLRRIFSTLRRSRR